MQDRRSNRGFAARFEMPRGYECRPSRVQKSPRLSGVMYLQRRNKSRGGLAGVTTWSEKVTEKLGERQTAGLSSYTPEGYPFFPLHFAFSPTTARCSYHPVLDSHRRLRVTLAFKRDAASAFYAFILPAPPPLPRYT